MRHQDALEPRAARGGETSPRWATEIVRCGPGGAKGVAACPNGSAMLFTSAKVFHLGSLPQGAPECESRVLDMAAAMDGEGFGGCTVTGRCTAVCPKGTRSPRSPR